MSPYWIFITSVVFYSSRLLLAQCASTDSFYFTRSPRDQDVEEGQPLRLECAVQPNEDIHYSWLQNGVRIDLERQSGRRYLEGDSNLRILHADREIDPGRYQCQALNKTSKFVSASREASINVYWMEPEIEVRLVRPGRLEDIRLGELVELACDVRAHPPAKMNNIFWFHNGNGRLPNMRTLPNGNLLIDSFGMQHVGSFHCRVIHAAGKVDSRPPFVIQMTAEDSPRVNTSVSGKAFLKYALAELSTELMCPRPPAAPEDGPVIVVWGFMTRLGEQQQPITSLPSVRPMGEADSILIIDRFKPVHANFYTCEVNVPTTSERYFYVFQVYLAELFTPKPSNFAPRPRQNQPLAIRLGERLELRYYEDLTPSQSYTAENISNPPPQIEWFRLSSGHEEPTRILPGSSTHVGANMRIYVKNGRHLVIKDAREEDSDAYEMVLSSVAGRVSVPFQIMVSFPPEFEPAKESQTLDEGEPLMLSCQIRRRAIPGSRIYWEKDGRPLVNYGNDILAEGDGELLRLPHVTVDHQGRYQCFVITDGYPRKFPGQMQHIEIRGRLQFVREIKEHFLEVNVQGKLTCKVRGYGQLNIDWFRKTVNGLESIQKPNQVENGVLIFQYVQKQDAGEYVCVARSNYRDEEIQMNVKVIVGEKPRISDISTNQTIQEGSRLVLNCKASGDPRPQISWIVKRPNIRDPFIYSALMSGQTNTESILENVFDPGRAGVEDAGGSLINPGPLDDRIQVLPNGSLVINQVLLKDEAEYICIAGNKHAIQTRQGVHVSVLTPHEYVKLEHGEETLSPGMARTIVIVVNCAIAYLGLIFGLTVYCSVRYFKNRRHRAQNAKTPESGHLIAQGGPSLTQDNNCVLLLNDEMMTTGSRAPTGSPNDTSATDLGVMQNFSNYRNNGSAKTYSPANNFVMGNDGPPPPSRQLFPPTTAVGGGGGGGGGANGTVYPVSVTSTTTGESCGSRMVAAPPPTPLDSRSHRSGLSSSGNSASAYSRSLISGASNSTGPPPPPFTSGGGGGAYTVHGSGGSGSIVLNGSALGGQYHHPSEMMGSHIEKNNNLLLNCQFTSLSTVSTVPIAASTIPLLLPLIAPPSLLDPLQPLR
ncbi:Inactive tyrosine-protein kinase 7 [Echinococcus granulosus]|nr:Inactive tyrosine-protein kinase 7 [Echinococcus granulosus]